MLFSHQQSPVVAANQPLGNHRKTLLRVPRERHSKVQGPCRLRVGKAWGFNGTSLSLSLFLPIEAALAQERGSSWSGLGCRWV